MNNHAIAAGRIIQKSLIDISDHKILNLKVSSMHYLNGKPVYMHIPVQMTMPPMVEKYKDIQIGTRVMTEGRFETYKSKDGKMGYNITQLTTFQPTDQGDMNIVVIWGRVSSEVRINTTRSGSLATFFSVANDRSYQKNGEWVTATSFIPVNAWGMLAENAANIKKGQAVWIIGKLQTTSYLNKDGQKVYLTGIAADVIAGGGTGKRYIIQDDDGICKQIKPYGDYTQGQDMEPPDIQQDTQRTSIMPMIPDFGQRTISQPIQGEQECSYMNFSGSGSFVPGKFSHIEDREKGKEGEKFVYQQKPTTYPSNSGTGNMDDYAEHINGFKELEEFSDDDELPFH